MNKKFGIRIIFICSLLTVICSLSCENPFFPDRKGKNEDLGIEMVSISAGSFTMGQDGIATPTRTVTLTQGFKMSKYEVTQGQWKEVMGTTIVEQQVLAGYSEATNYGRGDNYPMYCVSWYDAIVFCNKLSMMEGYSPAYKISGSTNPDDWGSVPTSGNATWNAVEIVSGSDGYRLPTEAQWEYACRAGTTTQWSYGDTGNGAYMWYSENNSGSPGDSTYGSKQVGTRQANAWGLYDMHGNVWEWCWDRYGTYGTVEPWLTNPAGAASGSFRIFRGGYWGDSASSTRSASRRNDNPYCRNHIIGFRLVRP